MWQQKGKHIFPSNLAESPRTLHRDWNCYKHMDITVTFHAIRDHTMHDYSQYLDNNCFKIAKRKFWVKICRFPQFLRFWSHIPKGYRGHTWDSGATLAYFYWISGNIIVAAKLNNKGDEFKCELWVNYDTDTYSMKTCTKQHVRCWLRYTLVQIPRLRTSVLYKIKFNLISIMFGEQRYWVLTTKN